MSRSRIATFVMSTGRSGTQWLADTLHRHYADLAEVRHEPIDHKYCPRLVLRSRAGLDGHPYRAEILAHVDYIRASMRERDYIETGWPAFASIPFLRDVFGPHLRVVHLTRHPVPAACSMVTHHYYQPELRDDGYTRFAILQPSDPGVDMKEYSGMWARLSPYEKCLFHWAEINSYSLQVRTEHNPNDWSQVRMEDLFAENTTCFATLLKFLGLPVRENVLVATHAHLDRYHTKTNLTVDWMQIGAHPEIVRLATDLGYDPLIAPTSHLADRYGTVVKSR